MEASHVRICAGLLVLATAACTRTLPAYSDDSTDDGGTTLGPYDPSTSVTTTPGDGDGDDPPPTTTESPPPDLPGPEECYLPNGNSCPPGDKCVPDVAAGFGVFECVPVQGDGPAGTPCVHDPDTNTDDCDGNSYCYEGLCRSFCDVEGYCPGDGNCYVDQSPQWLCMDACNPLLQDCPDGRACAWSVVLYGFECVLSQGRGLGEACIEIGDGLCAPGLECVPSDSYFGGECPGLDAACCINYCDPLLGDQACLAGPPGSTCVDIDLPEWPNVGLCTGGAAIEPGTLQVVEVNSDPPGITIYEARYEYVEVLHLGVAPIDLSPLRIHDKISSAEEIIGLRYEPIAGDGGCVSMNPYCLAPGHRVLFVGSDYIGETGDALVLAAANANIFNGLLQPFTRVELQDPDGPLVISSFREWPNPNGDPLPVDEQPLHRIDLAGPDVPDNWVSGPGSPGL